MQFVGTPPPDRKIIRLLGSGGMGVVYEALDERLDRHIALKVLHPHLTMNVETRDRLLQEARLAARVEHDNVVRIYNVHEVDTGLCLEMQFIDGVSLSHLLAREPLTPARAVDLLQQVLEALIACHSKDVVHADLKPGNLIITQEGRAYLADFGISRAIYADSGQGVSSVSLSGPLWGTPQYCPPEAWRGVAPNALWDLYALGVVVYEALCGTLPFATETPAVMMREKLEGKRRTLRDSPIDMSEALGALVDALSADDPDQRPASAELALKALRQTPELLTSSASTKTLRHREVATGPSMPLKLTQFTPLDPVRTSRGLAVWFSTVAIIGLIIGAATAYFFGGSPLFVPTTIVPAGEVGVIMNLTAGSEHAVFSYDDGEFGREPWVADIKGRVRRLADLTPGPDSSNPGMFLPGKSGGFFLTATTRESGMEPYILNPVAGSVHPIKDIVPGPVSSNPIPVAAWSNLYYFYADPMFAAAGLWVSNGGGDTTTMLRDVIGDGNRLDDVKHYNFPDETGIFTVWNDRGTRRLMRYAFETREISDFGIVYEDTREVAYLGDRVVLSMTGPGVGFELWWTEGGLDEAQLLTEFWPGEVSGNPEDFYVWKGEVYFRATTPDAGTELWKSDGTPEGTVMMHDLNAGEFDGDPSNFVGTEDYLFFRGICQENGHELWATTGAPGSTPRLYDIRPGPASSTPYSMARIGESLCFSADDGRNHGEEFWALFLGDPDSEPYEVEDIVPGPTGSEPAGLQPMTQTRGIFTYNHGRNLMLVVSNGKTVQLTTYGDLPRP